MKNNLISRINGDYEINEQQWVISILNTTGSLVSGHSAIVVEGLEADSKSIYMKPFIGQYDIAAASEEGGMNAKGYITKIKIFENEQNKRNYAEEKYPARSYYATPAAAKQMILSIKEDAGRTAQAMENWQRERS